MTDQFTVEMIKAAIGQVGDIRKRHACLYLDMAIDHKGAMDAGYAVMILRAAKDKHGGRLSMKPSVYNQQNSYKDLWFYLFKSILVFGPETHLPADLKNMMIVEFTDAYCKYSA